MKTWISAQLFLFYFTWCAYLSYWAVLLAGRGVDADIIGFSVTSGLVARSVSIAVVYPLVNNRASLLTVQRALPWISVLCAALFLPHGSTTLLLVASVALGFAYPVVMPNVETLTTLASKRGLLSYGPTRRLGSIGFISATLVIGAAIGTFGTEAILWIFLAGCAAMGLLALLPTGADEVGSQRSGTVRQWATLFRRREVLIMLGVMIALQASHGTYYTFGALRFEQLGAAPLVVSAMLLTAPVGEIVVLSLAPRIEARLTPRTMLACALVVAVLRWGALALSGSLALVWATQVLHGITFGLGQVAWIRFLANRVPPHLTGPANGMMTALASGLGTSVTTAFAGALWGTSPALAFAAMALVAALGVPVLAALPRRPRAIGPAPTEPDQ